MTAPAGIHHHTVESLRSDVEMVFTDAEEAVRWIGQVAPTAHHHGREAVERLRDLLGVLDDLSDVPASTSVAAILNEDEGTEEGEH